MIYKVKDNTQKSKMEKKTLVQPMHKKTVCQMRMTISEDS
jgi:hypothetical protein